MRKKYIFLKKITPQPINEPSNRLAESLKILKICKTISYYSVCQNKVYTFHFPGVILLTCWGSEKMPKESSHFSLAGNLKKCQKNVRPFHL